MDRISSAQLTATLGGGDVCVSESDGRRGDTDDGESGKGEQDLGELHGDGGCILCKVSLTPQFYSTLACVHWPLTPG